MHYTLLLLAFFLSIPPLFPVNTVVLPDLLSQAISHLLHTQVFPQFRLHEFYLCDIEETVRKFRRRIKGRYIFFKISFSLLINWNF